MAKPYARQFYSSKAWQDCRNEYAKKVHHLCENCLRQGIYKPGEIVHHRIEISPLNIDRPEITLNHKNLELLCRECHALRHDGKTGWKVYNRKRRKAKESTRRYLVDEQGKVTSK
jgi:5-methylcytosine-specific restriction endonuclease McrA